MPLPYPGTQYGGGDEAAYYDLQAADRIFALPRNEVGGVVTLTSGETHYTYFSAASNILATSIATVTGSTAQATPTTCKHGIYRVETDNSLTLLTDCANLTTVWNAVNARFTQTFTAVQLSAGVRYACAALFVGTTAPTLLSSGTAAAFQTGLGLVDQVAPVRAAKKASQTDLTTPISTFIAALGRVYFEVIGTLN